ncbi:50S ribosomal protein L33-like [Melia azedarach]|uniref:50S ribosomal protein L33-like n=1 Tax=Melia azedarach TaxID=155640 RepID=A0ACC1YGM1_MELAZ|nr:50S ribosomal protein L33-like [Melia azedarach]
MGDKKKTFMFVRLVSAAGTGFFYVKRKSAKKVLEKLEFRKYDPRVNRHVLFTEAKMKNKPPSELEPTLNGGKRDIRSRIVFIQTWAPNSMHILLVGFLLEVWH